MRALDEWVYVKCGRERERVQSCRVDGYTVERAKTERKNRHATAIVNAISINVTQRTRKHCDFMAWTFESSIRKACTKQTSDTSKVRKSICAMFSLYLPGWDQGLSFSLFHNIVSHILFSFNFFFLPQFKTRWQSIATYRRHK